MYERAQPSHYKLTMWKSRSDSIVMESPKNLSKFNAALWVYSFDRGIFVLVKHCVQSLPA